MKATFFVWGLVSKNRLLINLIKKLISPIWTHKYRKDREVQIERFLEYCSIKEVEREPPSIAQVAIITDKLTKKQMLRGATDFFAHIGVQVKPIKRLGDERFLTHQHLVVDLTAKENGEFVIRRQEHYSILKGPFENLTIEKSGLRSSCCATLLSILTQELDFPLITTLSKSLIGFRIDDVTPSPAMFSFLEAANERKIPINLGLFLDAFHDNDQISQIFFNKFNNTNFDFSPHAFNELTPIFFDLKHNKPFSSDEIQKNLEKITNFFSRWNIDISPVINAHFHSADINALRAFNALGGRFFISEIHPRYHKIIFDERFLPQGDPVNCTGAKHFSIFQLYSGDSSRDHLNKTNCYDFLDNSNGDEKKILSRSFKRLELSLSTGFPAFITSHGYEIDKHAHALDRMCFLSKVRHWKESNFPEAKFAKLADLCSAFEERAGSSISIDTTTRSGNKFVDFRLRKRESSKTNITCIGLGKTVMFDVLPEVSYRVKYGQKKIQII